jgi:hypothetical protein
LSISFLSPIVIGRPPCLLQKWCPSFFFQTDDSWTSLLSTVAAPEPKFW